MNDLNLKMTIRQHNIFILFSIFIMIIIHWTWNSSGSEEQTRTLEGKLSWSEIWQAESQVLGSSRVQLITSPANLHIWGKSDSPACPLCAGEGSLKRTPQRLSSSLGGGLLMETRPGGYIRGRGHLQDCGWWQARLQSEGAASATVQISSLSAHICSRLGAAS